jgi:tetratricopeptide (TPR) repeat protein
MAQITLRDYLQETEDAIANTRIDDALAHCQQILASFPESLEAQRLLGEIYLAQGHLEEAQQTFDWVLTNDPENIIVYCDRALISERSSDYDTALDCYQQAYELSRGNSDIRNQFNKLNAKVGQQGFMFSRAGLARLYMRGDLLPQAIQEWETVLAGNPDRLDARTGLLEAYWREHLYDRVEYMATQILQDVPGCLKALLLLAYVSSIRSMQQAQEYLKKAEALDPDLIMAQDLFADLIASQPNEPFLQLLQKPAVYIETSPATSSTFQAPPSSPSVRLEEALLASRDAQSASNSTNALSSGLSLDSWGSEGAFATSQQDSPAKQEASAFSFWPDDSLAKVDPWSSLAKPQENGLQEQKQEMPDFVRQLGMSAPNLDPWAASEQSNYTAQDKQPAKPEEPPFAPWQSFQESQETSSSSSSQEQQLLSQGPAVWENLDKLMESTFNSADPWGAMSTTSEAEPAWGSAAKEGDSPSPPAWLNMLTQSERRQMGEASPPVADQSPSAPLVSSSPLQPASQQPQDPAESFLGTSPFWKAEQALTRASEQPEAPQPSAPPAPAKPSTPVVEEQDDDSFFGPAWLKSLGAEAIESDPVEEGTPDMSHVEPDAKPVYTQPEAQSQPVPSEIYDPWTTPSPSPTASNSTAEPDWLQQLTEPEWMQQPAETAHIVQETTPVWGDPAASMPSIPQPTSEPATTQEQNLLTTLEELEYNLRSQGFVPLEPNSLSAVAQTQNAASTPIDTTHANEPYLPEQVQPEPSLSSALAELGSFVQRPPEADSPPASVSPAASVPAAPRSVEEFAPGPVVPLPSPASAEVTTKAPVSRLSALFDGELETTMRRPAVRLQPMQQKRSGMHEQPVSSRTRSTERERLAVNKVADSDLSNQERLLKGYQHQLVGDYDEAMQEYRVIIRNAPELLGEVVSNVRALLKLAPKYSTGYRVLGDAYMRQGEYLQAMESYNKALTMAKRARA